jgi:hypothetical protein
MVSGSTQAKKFSKKREKEDISCLKSFLLGWIFLEPDGFHRGSRRHV